jgi:hypothetical protein
MVSAASGYCGKHFPNANSSYGDSVSRIFRRNKAHTMFRSCRIPASNWTQLQWSSATQYLLVAEEIMAKDDHVAQNKDEPVAVSDHTEKIRSQVLEKVGKPPRMHRVEVCRHHNGNYRVNIWEQLESVGDFAFSMNFRIRSSYYLKVSETGEIIRSNPPLTKLI